MMSKKSNSAPTDTADKSVQAVPSEQTGDASILPDAAGTKSADSSQGEADAAASTASGAGANAGSVIVLGELSADVLSALLDGKTVLFQLNGETLRAVEDAITVDMLLVMSNTDSVEELLGQAKFGAATLAALNDSGDMEWPVDVVEDPSKVVSYLLTELNELEAEVAAHARGDAVTEQAQAEERRQFILRRPTRHEGKRHGIGDDVWLTEDEHRSIERSVHGDWSMGIRS